MPAAPSNQRCMNFMGAIPSMMSQAFLTLSTQSPPSRQLIKRLSEENMLNYRVSGDDPAPHIDNLSSYLYISSLALPSWWWSRISLLLWQAVKAILPRQSSLHLLVISSVLNVILIESLGTLVFLSQMPPAKENTTFLYFHVLPEKNPQCLFSGGGDHFHT